MIRTLHRFIVSFIVIAILVSLGSALPFQKAHAAEGEFYLQVSPSPLVTTLKPGQKAVLDLKVRNAGTEIEKLTIAPHSFKMKNDGKIELNDVATPEIAGWLNFSAKDFTVAPGQLFEQKVTIEIPKEAGFSYSFAFLIKRADADPDITKGQELKGQVAVFALLNIDRPGAKRELQIETISSEAGIYEYLPATLKLRLKNTGNTIVQPAGDVFIQRGTNDETPIDTLAVNKNASYILPDTTRELLVEWSNGFPATKKDSSGNEYLDWNWQNLANIRIGHYTAKAIVIYNDGQRDIPIVAEVGFWVIPWKILLGILLVAGLIGFGLWSILSKVIRFSRGGKQSIRLGK